MKNLVRIGENLRFEELEVSEKILKGIEEMGFEEMTPIQSKAIPEILTGIDIIGQAQTGTGKTAAFGIPILQKIDESNKNIQALILCPTRELAIQVADEIRKISKFLFAIKVLPIYGGQDISKQIRSIKAGAQIVVGTPGRVMDHMRRKTMKLDHVKMVALDEADEMLNMGFREDIEVILQSIPDDRQTILFSATMPKAILDITNLYQKDAKIIKVTRKELTVENIEQYYYEVRPQNKEEILSRLIDIFNPKLSIVFCNTKKQVDTLVMNMQGRGYFVDSLHGDMKQQQRDRVMNAFRTGNIDILVATDVAARGIDVENVDIVFNYDIPQDEEYYVHRIGRTGRAGKAGLAISFVFGREVYKLKDIQKYCKTKINAKPIPSVVDVHNTKIDKIFFNIQDIIKNQDLTNIMQILEDKINEADYTTMDVAAALVKLSVGEEKEEKIDLHEAPFETKEKSGGHGGERSKRSSSSTMSRLFFNIGKNQKVLPKDILGAIAGETGIPGKQIGSIEMFDKYTFVEIPKKHEEKVIKIMCHAKIKGKKVNVEKANAKDKRR